MGGDGAVGGSVVVPNGSGDLYGYGERLARRVAGVRPVLREFAAYLRLERGLSAARQLKHLEDVLRFEKRLGEYGFRKRLWTIPA